MRRLRLGGFVFSFLMLGAAANAATATVVDPDQRYETLLAEAKAKAPNADWLGLRIAYSRRREFRIISDSPDRAHMLETAESGDCGAALPAARATLATDFVDVDAHMIAAWCEDKAGQADAARLDRDIGAGLVKSIETGDGRTPKTAFTPITVDEEYALMRALGLTLTGQSMVEDGGHSYDSVTARDADGNTQTFYFLIDRLLAAQAESLKPGSLSEGGPPSRTP